MSPDRGFAPRAIRPGIAAGRAGERTVLGRADAPRVFRGVPSGRCLILAAALMSPLAGPDDAHGQRAPAPGRFEVFEATIPELQAALESGRVTSVDLVEAYLARIEAYDRGGPLLNSIIRINPNARAEARALDEERRTSGPRGPLHGIPIILKDNYDTADLPTSASSLALAGLIPPDDAFQVRKLREAGAVILAKSNLHELAMGITSISSLGGQTRNPYDPLRNPGGSSGGTGAAIAASFAAVGWGSDTCGSIRIPSAHNALVGLRPTKGLSSVDGIIPLAHTQDVGGPMARTVMDLAIALDATIGPDPADPATAALEGRALPRFVAALDSGALRGARLGVLRELFDDPPADEEVARVVGAAIAQMEALGAEVVNVTIPELRELLTGSSVIDDEAKYDLADYLAGNPAAPVSSLDEIVERGLFHEALEATFRRRVRTGTRDSAEYKERLARRTAIQDTVVRALDGHRLDAVIYPTASQRPALIGAPQGGTNCTLSAVTGLPALAVPAGFSVDGLPIGLELLGRPFDDTRLVALAYAFEQATHHRRPPATTPPLTGAGAPGPVRFAVSAAGGSLPTPVESRATARGDFTWDIYSRALGYRITVSGVPADQVYALTLARGEDGSAGRVIHRLSGPGIGEVSGTVTLSASDAEALAQASLHLMVYTRDHPLGAARGTLVLPAAGSPRR